MRGFRFIGMKRYNLILTILAFFSATVFPLAAQNNPVEEVVTERVVITRYLSDGSMITDTITGNPQVRIESQSVAQSYIDGINGPGKAQAGKSRKRTKMSNVMLGFELSTAMDLSGTDMSTFNADLVVGYRHKVIQLLGASLGIHKSLGTRDSFIPIQVLLRTSFTARPSLAFMHLSTGYSFNTISNSPMFGDYMATIGAGCNLTRKPRFQSNIILAFGFRHLNQRHQELTKIEKPNLGFVQISFGISM